MRGELVYLDRVRDSDDADLLADWGSGISNLYSSGRPIILTREQVEQLVRGPETDLLMVRTVAENEPIGMVTWRQQTYPGSYTMGVAIGDPERWGLGMGMEAVILLVSHLFHTLNAHRLHVEVAAFNVGMLPVLTSGMIKIEGVLRDYFFVDGEYHDCIVGSMLRDEYYETAKSFGGPADGIPAQAKAAARERIEALLAERGLSALGRSQKGAWS